MFKFWPEILAGICIGLCPFEHLFAYIWELNSWKSCKFHPISKLRRVALRTKWTRHERTRKRRRSNGSKQLQLYELVRHCWSFAWEAYLCGQFKGRCCGFNPLSPAWIYLDSVSYHLGPPNLAIVLGVCLSWRYFYLLDLWRSACWSILHKHLHRLDQGIRIYLNCGDHGHIADAIIAKLQVGICLVWSCKMFRFESILKCVFLPWPIWYLWILVGSTIDSCHTFWWLVILVGNVNFSLLKFVGLILGLERSHQQWGHSATLQEGGLRKVGRTCRLEGAGPDRKCRDFWTGRET